MERLDKFLSDSGLGTRKEVRQLICRGLVSVDGVVIKDFSAKFDFDEVEVCCDGESVSARRCLVCVLNKPAGYVTSTDDPVSPTVMELVPEKYRQMKVVPVGRLDKDTEGVLLFTNDGALLHRLISPKSGIEKTYYAEFEGLCPSDAEKRFAEGIVLKDGTVCKSAVFEKLSESSFRLTLTEGMYHQVKRMAAACGMHVKYLFRESFAGIGCQGIEKGQFRELDLQELNP